MATYTIAPETLAYRLFIVRDYQTRGLIKVKFPRIGTLRPGEMPLSARFCAAIWGTDPQGASVTLRALRESGDLILVREGTRGGRGKPAVYRFPLLPPRKSISTTLQ